MVDRRRAIAIILIEFISLVILALVVWVLFTSAAPAPAPLRDIYRTVPERVSYQGQVAVNGTPFDSVGQFKFAIINAPGTVAYWSNDGTGLETAPFTPTAFITLTVDDGLFSVYLGDTSIPGMVAITRDVFTPTYNTALRVWFNDGTHDWQMLTPDTKFSSSPYAFVSAWSYTAISSALAITSEWATTAGSATTALTATWATTATDATTALTSTWATTATWAETTANVLTATWATTSTFATMSLTSTRATTSTMAENAVWALNAIIASSSLTSLSATASISSTWATTASYALASPSSGTITQVVAGTGLNGGGTSGAVTVTLNTSITLVALNVDTITSTSGLNVGTAGAATSGSIRYSGDLQANRNSTYYTAYALVPLAAHLTSSSWDGDAKNASTSIDLQSVFNAPAGIKAVMVRMVARDETAGVGFYVGTSASYLAVGNYTQVANAYIAASGVSPCDANGDIYFWLSGELDEVYIYIYGYWI